MTIFPSTAEKTILRIHSLKLLKKILDISEHTKLLILSFVVGLASGCSAVLLSWLIRFIKGLLNGSFSSQAYNWQYLVYPGIGMLISLFMLKYLVRDNIGHGVTKVLLAVSRNESRIKPHNMWSSILTSSVTIGFGGSVGAEAPIVYTGAAIGSNIGRKFGMTYRDITILLGCGAAGAVAGIFKAPLAGVLFTMEILLFNISMSSLLPLLISSISATVVAYIFEGQRPMFECNLDSFSMGNIPYYIVLGVIMGFCALYFTNTTLWLEDKLGKIKNQYFKWVACALSLGVLIFLFPPLYGEGYDVLGDLLSGRELSIENRTIFGALVTRAWGVPLFFLMVFLTKIIAMTVTNAGGGNGGTFGPTLFAGAIMGFTAARTFNLIGCEVPEPNFVLVGMAALMSAVMQAPLTAIFLIAEISGGYELLVPLILTATISYGTVRIFDRYSIYTKRIAQSGDLLTHDNDQAVLTLMNISTLIRDKYPRVHLNQTLGHVVEVVSDSSAAVLAVVDEDGTFQGMVDVGNIHKDLFNTREYDTKHVYNLMESPQVILRDNEKMDSVMAKFDKTGAWRLPVVDAEGRYLGFISRSRLLMAYRAELKEISVED